MRRTGCSHGVVQVGVGFAFGRDTVPEGHYSRSMRWLRDGAERRRSDRRRRKHTYVAMSGGLLLVLLLSLPSLISHSPMSHSMLQSMAARYGWTVSVASIRVGWMTPLRLTGLEATGPSGETQITVDSLDTPLTVLDLIRGRSDFGTVHANAPRLETVVVEGGSRLEEDLATLREGPERTEPLRGEIRLRDASVKMVHDGSGRRWRADQLQMTLHLDAKQTDVDVQGVVTDPDGISGALEARVVAAADGSGAIDADAETEGVPLSLLELAAIRFPELNRTMPATLAGNLTGRLRVRVDEAGEWRCDAAPVDIRNLLVADLRWNEAAPWRASRATIEGSAWKEGKHLRTERLVVRSDAGQVEFHGSIDTEGIEAARYLDSLVGEFSADVDLATLVATVPDMIPLREGVTIESGRVRSRVSGGYGADGQYRSSWNLQTEPIRATIAGGNAVVFEPLSADVTLRPVGQWVSAEKVHIRSRFGDATASGDLRSGRAQFNVDFRRLASMLRSVVEMPETNLDGIASGNIRWSVDEGNRWTLGGSATASNLAIWMPGDRVLRRPSLDVAVTAQGVWGGDSLERLDHTLIKLSDPAQSWDIELVEQVEWPGAETVLPLRITGGGRLDALVNLLGPWMPDKIAAVGGSVEAEVRVNAAIRSGRVLAANIALRDATAVLDQRRYDQGSIKFDFAGAYDWPSGDLDAKTLTLSGNAISLAVQGEMIGGTADLEVAYRADMSRLQGAVTRRDQIPALTQRDVNGQGAIAQVAFRATQQPIDAAWHVTGQVVGRAEIERRDWGPWLIAFDAAGKQIEVLQPPAITAPANFVGPVMNTPANLQPTVVWAEPTLSVGGNLHVAAAGADVHAEQLRVATQWAVADLAGDLKWKHPGHEIHLRGPAKLDSQIAGERLTRLLGEPILMTGTHHTPLQIRAASTPAGDEEIDIVGSVGWDRGQIAGVNLGGAKIPVRVTETTVFVDPATVPLERGQLKLDGEVHYRPGPIWFEQRPGVFAQGVALTPEMCRSWLKYMMPLAADATDVSGAFSVELDECVVIPSDPVRSRVSGTLQVEGAAVGPGPLVNRLMTSLEQIEAATKGLQGEVPQAKTARPWIRMEPQAVDFAMISGIVTHQRMLMRAGKADMISSGNVALDGRLDLRIQVPLQEQWLGSRLTALAGQQVTLPVTGTLAKPSLDTRAVTEVLAQLGTQAVQASVDNYLQRQVDKQWQKIFGK